MTADLSNTSSACKQVHLVAREIPSFASFGKPNAYYDNLPQSSCPDFTNAALHGSRMCSDAIDNSNASSLLRYTMGMARTGFSEMRADMLEPAMPHMRANAHADSSAMYDNRTCVYAHNDAHALCDSNPRSDRDSQDDALLHARTEDARTRSTHTLPHNCPDSSVCEAQDIRRAEQEPLPNQNARYIVSRTCVTSDAVCKARNNSNNNSHHKQQQPPSWGVGARTAPATDVADDRTAQQCWLCGSFVPRTTGGDGSTQTSSWPGAPALFFRAAFYSRAAATAQPFHVARGDKAHFAQSHECDTCRSTSAAGSVQAQPCHAAMPHRSSATILQAQRTTRADTGDYSNPRDAASAAHTHVCCQCSENKHLIRHDSHSYCSSCDCSACSCRPAQENKVVQAHAHSRETDATFHATSTATLTKTAKDFDATEQGCDALRTEHLFLACSKTTQPCENIAPTQAASGLCLCELCAFALSATDARDGATEARAMARQTRMLDQRSDAFIAHVRSYKLLLQLVALRVHASVVRHCLLTDDACNHKHDEDAAAPAASVSATNADATTAAAQSNGALNYFLAGSCSASKTYMGGDECVRSSENNDEDVHDSAEDASKSMRRRSRMSQHHPSSVWSQPSTDHATTSLRDQHILPVSGCQSASVNVLWTGRTAYDRRADNSSNIPTVPLASRAERPDLPRKYALHKHLFTFAHPPTPRACAADSAYPPSSPAAAACERANKGWPSYDSDGNSWAHKQEAMPSHTAQSRRLSYADESMSDDAVCARVSKLWCHEVALYQLPVRVQVKVLSRIRDIVAEVLRLDAALSRSFSSATRATPTKASALLCRNNTHAADLCAEAEGHFVNSRNTDVHAPQRHANGLRCCHGRRDSDTVHRFPFLCDHAAMPWKQNSSSATSNSRYLTPAERQLFEGEIRRFEKVLHAFGYTMASSSKKADQVVGPIIDDEEKQSSFLSQRCKRCTPRKHKSHGGDVRSNTRDGALHSRGKDHTRREEHHVTVSAIPTLSLTHTHSRPPSTLPVAQEFVAVNTMHAIDGIEHDAERHSHQNHNRYQSGDEQTTACDTQRTTDGEGRLTPLRLCDTTEVSIETSSVNDVKSRCTECMKWATARSLSCAYMGRMLQLSSSIVNEYLEVAAHKNLLFAQTSASECARLWR